MYQPPVFCIFAARFLEDLNNMDKMRNVKIAVVGLGYVGLPLAIEYGKKYRVLGFDINKERVAELERGEDHTLEADLAGMKQATGLFREKGSALRNVQIMSCIGILGVIRLLGGMV